MIAELLLILLLAGLLGVELIHRIPSRLHTPLMSGTNAISGITIVGAIGYSAVGGEVPSIATIIALFASAVNVVGGYVVTHRMLRMFDAGALVVERDQRRSQTGGVES